MYPLGMRKRGDLVTYTQECAVHSSPDGMPCPSTLFRFDAERPAAEDEYVCLTCLARVIGDEHCLAVNRSPGKK